ncbi:DUF1622 domain-containing protein [Alterinioella nitratireducens]|uniref:DUF1622 domain-containing protein n=1 Tax=Alterinioella nitratireducens TaxID=2735915 RepID=UPI004059709E
MGGILNMDTDGGILHGPFGWLVEIMEWAAALIDIAAMILILIGGVRFILGVAKAELVLRNNARVNKTNQQRIELGRYILASLELFIVSDIVHTVLSLALSDLVFLGLLVVIRSIIFFFLDRELAQIKKELKEDAPRDTAVGEREDSE